MYEQSMRMPLLVSYPRRVRAGQVHDGIVTNVDFARTILEFAEVPAHPRMQGRSFAGDLTGSPGEPAAEGMYYRCWEHDDIFHKAPAHYGWRDRRYKLIYFYNDGMCIPGAGGFTYPGEWELYDLEADPDELRNVFHAADYRAVRQALQVKLRNAQHAVSDRCGDAGRHPRRQRYDKEQTLAGNAHISDRNVRLHAP